MAYFFAILSARKDINMDILFAILEPFLVFASSNWLFLLIIGVLYLLSEGASGTSYSGKTYDKGSTDYDVLLQNPSEPYEANGSYRTAGSGYFDGRGIWRKPGECFYDGRGYFRKPGDCYFDGKGYWRSPDEGFFDGKGYWRDPGDGFFD